MAALDGSFEKIKLQTNNRIGGPPYPRSSTGTSRAAYACALKRASAARGPPMDFRDKAAPSSTLIRPAG
jgi:hypothetical protein